MKKHFIAFGIFSLISTTSCFSQWTGLGPTSAKGIEGTGGGGKCSNNSSDLNKSMMQRFGISASREMPVTFKNGIYAHHKTYYLTEEITDNKLLTFCNKMELTKPIYLDELTSKEFIKYLYNLQEFSEVHNQNKKLMLKNRMSIGNPFAIKSDVDLEMLKSLNLRIEKSIKKIKELEKN